MSSQFKRASCAHEFVLGNGQKGRFFSLQKLEALGFSNVPKLPVSLRIVLEALIRNADGERVRDYDVEQLANWQPNEERSAEIPFVVARVLLQDFTGVPLLVDLAAMRSAVSALGKDPKIIEPLVPVDLVVDHSIQVDVARQKNALDLNMKLEFERNKPRYEFLKWGTQAFDTFRIVPPGVGIVHQVNLEYLAHGVLQKDGVYYPDTLVGTDSHTTMINGLGIVGWGVGGIEAEAGMLGQPVYFLTPDVIGVHLAGALREGVTATDLVLHITELLRKTNVVGKFVEFFGEGAKELSLAERATVANMAPEYGATMGYFPIDEETCKYLSLTGRSDEDVKTFRNYYTAQGLFGMPKLGDCHYTQTIEISLANIVPCVAGPKRPQDRIALSALKKTWEDVLTSPKGYNKSNKDAKFHALEYDEPNTVISHGSVLIAAITSCTNTSNPGVMLAAGLLAQKAVALGLSIAPHVKTSLAPGSRVVTEYLKKTNLLQALETLGFDLVGYGCTTCIGNSGPLDESIEATVKSNDIITASVLSGNRNFEARVHPSIKANFLMSPPLVVALAIAGTVDIDLGTEPLGEGNGKPVYLRDIWPSPSEIQEALRTATDAETYRKLYSHLENANPFWSQIVAPKGKLYAWDKKSTYIQEPPYFQKFASAPEPTTDIKGARILAVFGDSITTDHISPAGSIEGDSPAGRFLERHGVAVADFNSYGSRRGNHEVMLRGTFANVRIKNLLMAGLEGGLTKVEPSGEIASIYDAAYAYQKSNTPLVVFAGQEYGTGSSRDWAAKGTKLLGVRAVIAQSFERIHRSNLVGMGVLPCELPKGTTPESLKLNGSETVDIIGVSKMNNPGQPLICRISRADGSTQDIAVTARIDTPIEVLYYRHGGILPYVLRQILKRTEH